MQVLKISTSELRRIITADKLTRYHIFIEFNTFIIGLNEISVENVMISPKKEIRKFLPGGLKERSRKRSK